VSLVVRFTYFTFAVVAQLVERVHGKNEVTGSIPVNGSTFPIAHFCFLVYNVSMNKKKMLLFLKNNAMVFAVIAIVAILGAGFLSYKLYAMKKSPTVAAQAEVAALVEKVGKLIVLPENETPTIATVSDPDILSKEAFFAQAEKGDKVLIYTTSQKAILFSVSKIKFSVWLRSILEILQGRKK
jgi:hypothetical protein